MRNSLAIVAALVVASAAAAEMPLAEFRYEGSSNISGSPLQLLFRATAGDTIVELTDTFPARSPQHPGGATVGRSTHITDPELLARLQTVFTSPNTQFFWDSAARNASFPMSQLMTFGDPNYRPHLAVPPQGVGLTGYRITRARYDAGITYFGGASTFTYHSGQEIVLYGVVIPEPASFVLLLVAHLSMSPFRPRKATPRCRF